jgi:phosphoglycerate dehydrogenase-like enzyme
MTKIKFLVATALGIAFLFLTTEVTSQSSVPSSKQVERLIERFSLRESKSPSKAMKNWRQVKKVVVWGDKEDAAHFQTASSDIKVVASTDIDTVKRELTDADVFVGYCIPALIDSSLSVAYFQSLAVGVENCINEPVFKTKNITLTNSQRLSSPNIAEHAIAMMFSLVRRLDQYATEQTKSEWNRRLEPGDEKVWEIEGRTMLVVGLGGIGTETARRAKALGMEVLATRNSSKTGPDFVDYVGLSDELLSLAKRADVVVNTVPLTAKTTGIFNKAFFKAMPNHGYFINIARGRSVVTNDLIDALNNAEIAGAGLDVTDPEPLPKDHPLWKQPRVIITPHIAYRSDKLSTRIQAIALENLKRYIRGEKLLSEVNIQRGY